jgi:hypothetical protein
LECLKYAHEKGCHWDESTCYGTSFNRHLECVKYLLENGCPIDMDKCLRNAGRECSTYLKNVRDEIDHTVSFLDGHEK